MVSENKKYFGVCLLWAVAMIPIVLWLLDAEIDLLTSSLGAITASIGKAVALSGIALYALMPVLSMRHAWLEKVFGGLDHVYRLHTKAGKTSFFLIVLHPVLLGLGRLIDGGSFTTIWDWSSLLVLSGILAFCVLIFVTVSSIYAHIKHQKWVWIHRIFGWILPLFFLHALVARSQIVQNKALLIYMLLIGVAGFTAFLYRSVFGRLLIHKHKYEVTEVNRFTPDVAEIVLKPKGVPMTYEAGQFAFVSFSADGVDAEAHPFSFSNANNGPYVRFTVKALGDDTTMFQKLKEGTPTRIEGPYGKFSYKNLRNRKQVWIAGGIGITPFLSMARSFSGPKEHDIRFFYGCESLDEAVFLQEFMDITRHIPENFHTTVVSKKTSGFVTVKLLEKSLRDLQEFDYMICGPPGMMKALETQLRDAGVPARQIHVEAFSM